MKFACVWSVYVINVGCELAIEEIDMYVSSQ